MRRIGNDKENIFEKVFSIIRLVPRGRVATYGQIASLIGGCTPRVVGFALASLPCNHSVPWHRVINSKGKISLKDPDNSGSSQRQLLEKEGIIFGESERIDLTIYGWIPNS